MTLATIDLAELLKVEERQAVAEDATIRARWGADAGDSTQSSPLTREADALAEAARQLTLLGLAFGDDVATLQGIWPGLEGETIALDYTSPAGAGRLGLTGLQSMLVTRAQVDRATGLTTVQGLVVLP